MSCLTVLSVQRKATSAVDRGILDDEAADHVAALCFFSPQRVVVPGDYGGVTDMFKKAFGLI